MFWWCWQTVNSVAASNASTSDETATVTIIPMTTFGERLSEVPAVAVLTSVGSKVRHESRSPDLKFEKLPFGLYEVRLQGLGFSTALEMVGVYQPHIEFRIALPLWGMHLDERPRVSGTVTLAEGGKGEMWIRLMPLYSGQLIQATIDQSGRFDVAGMPPGRYLLAIFQGSDLLHVESVDAPTSGTRTLKVQVTGTRK
jgi:hypothetical protein